MNEEKAYQILIDYLLGRIHVKTAAQKLVEAAKEPGPA